MLLLPLAYFAAACGAGGGPSFAVRADEICAHEAKATRAVPSARTFAAQRRVFDRRAALIRAEIESLSRLDPPAGREASLRGLVAAIRDELAAAEDLRVASLSSDIESAQGAVYRGTHAARRASVFARRLGLKMCARPSRTP